MTQSISFKKYQGQWHVQGPADELQPGAEVTVEKRNGSTTTVTVAEVVYTAPAPSNYALASIVSDQERMTTRERKEAKADRLREWADSREVKSEAAYDRAKQISDMIPFGQPILVGHHSEGRHRRDAERIESGFRQSFEHQAKADTMRSRADGIASQLDRSIYSDDTDAVEKLRDRIADLEDQRERIKAENAAYRSAHKDEFKTLTAYQKDQVLPHPSYVLTNLGGNITRNRKRLAQLEARQ